MQSGAESRVADDIIPAYGLHGGLHDRERELACLDYLLLDTLQDPEVLLLIPGVLQGPYYVLYST
jgi:hypothetical protein